MLTFLLNRKLCKHLGIGTAPVSTQTLQRDRHAYYIATLALIATSLEKFAVEIRNLQKTETREVEEAFAKGQKGSSAMPHKRNPIGSENAQLLKSHCVVILLQLMRMCHYGMKEIFLILLLSVLCFRCYNSTRLCIESFHKYCGPFNCI